MGAIHWASARRVFVASAVLVAMLAGGAASASAAVDETVLSANIQALLDHVRATAGRKFNIVTQQHLPQDAVSAANPRAGQPTRVVHIDPSARPGGNGTAERPFQTLSDFQELSAAQQASYDIIYVHGSGGIHVLDEPLVLAPWQRLLSDSVSHTFDSSGGSFALPGYDPLNAPPTIMSTTGDVIVLSHNNEVAGFYIDAGRGNTGSAIVGNGVSGFNINRNEIRNGINGVSIRSQSPLNFNSVGNISDNTFDNFLNDGVQITHGGPGSLNLTIDNNIATRNQGTGFNITADGAHLDLTVTNNTATGNGTGFVVNSRNGATVDAVVRNNDFSGSTGLNNRVTFNGGTFAGGRTTGRF